MIDRETEQRVWQRVLGQETLPGDLARLLRLSRMQTREMKTVDMDLYRREQAVLGLLTGLYEISGGTPLPAEKGAPGISGNNRLRRCRDRCRDMLVLCIRLENHGRYGPVFTDLTRYLRAACARLEQRMDGSRKNGTI